MSDTKGPRAVVYTVDTSAGRRKIVIDRLHKEDIGEAQARSTFLHDGLVNGYDVDLTTVNRHEVGELPH